ncbi:LysR family transcriptional regulator [Paenibacillus endoradicis]|uniref:LysR family transcriptional regulator n=1 Tax=Paenibacillus endoradicis TaxID=2972487 RepID=UPI002158B2B0|nr:LysR family transcriptional regulator [Paenibacillus endoradicis]MCR8659413.1 LysR family transcriptional regulator [Paenibacillus endoradicis]
MNISQLETLLTISKTMSFRKAGELLNLTQPAVSAQIKSLEEEFNTILIDRNQPVTLTEHGQVFLEHAERMLSIVDDLKQRLSDLNDNPQGHIILGTTASIAVQVLPRVLSYFQNQYPLIKTTIHTMPSSQVMSSVDNGSVDIGITYLTEKNANISSSILYYDTFEFIVAPENPLSSYDFITMDQLQHIPLIMLAPDTLGRRFVDKICKVHNLTPNIVMELSSSEEVKRMVEINLGAAIVSKLSIEQELKLGTLKIIRVEELEATHPVGVVYKSGRYINSAMQQFISDLKGMPEYKFMNAE